MAKPESELHHARVHRVQAAQLPDEEVQAEHARPRRVAASTAAGAGATRRTGRPARWLARLDRSGAARRANAAEWRRPQPRSARAASAVRHVRPQPRTTQTGSPSASTAAAAAAASSGESWLELKKVERPNERQVFSGDGRRDCCCAIVWLVTCDGCRTRPSSCSSSIC